jgi:hypothetical protein
MTDPGSTTKTEKQEDHDVDTPHAKRAERLHGKPDQLKKTCVDEEDHQEDLLDEGVDETFPASDPVSVKRIT